MPRFNLLSTLLLLSLASLSPVSPLSLPARRAFVKAPIIAAASFVAVGAGVIGKSSIDGPKPFTPGGGSMEGKIVVITGANTGLGLESTKRLVEAGARVVMCGRSVERLEKASDSVKALYPKADLDVVELDLGDLSSIAAASKTLNSLVPRIDTLILNAGIMALPKRVTTVDGFERQLGVNHLGHFAFVKGVVGLVGKANDGRVITVASSAQQFGTKASILNLSDQPMYTPWGAYGQSKLANVIFAEELQRRADKAEVKLTSVSLHPGVIATDLGRYMMDTTKPATSLSTFAATAAQKLLRPIPNGANSHVYLASLSTSPEPGAYYTDMKLAKKNVRGGAGDEEVGRRLWEQSEEMTGLKFDFK